MRAAVFGEANPTLVAATEMTLAEAERRVFPEGAAIDGPVEGQATVPDDALVWLVRMRGTFHPPHGPEITQATRKYQGWMYTIIDAETGQTIASGIRPNDVPLR